MEGDVITLQDIFLFDFGMGVDEHGRFQGHLKATGVRPEVRREARRPRHPPRPGGLPARGLLPQGGRRPVNRLAPAPPARRAVVVVASLGVAVALGRPRWPHVDRRRRSCRSGRSNALKPAAARHRRTSTPTGRARRPRSSPNGTEGHARHAHAAAAGTPTVHRRGPRHVQRRPRPPAALVAAKAALRRGSTAAPATAASTSSSPSTRPTTPACRCRRSPATPAKLLDAIDQVAPPAHAEAHGQDRPVVGAAPGRRRPERQQRPAART